MLLTPSPRLSPPAPLSQTNTPPSILPQPPNPQTPQAFDGSQLYGSAAPYLAGTPYEPYSPYLFVGMFARDCGARPYCRTVATTGPRSAPLARNLVATLRAYVNPATGRQGRKGRAGGRGGGQSGHPCTRMCMCL